MARAALPARTASLPTETSLFDVASEKLFWSAAAATRIGGKDQKLIKDYVATMMDATCARTRWWRRA